MMYREHTETFAALKDHLSALTQRLQRNLPKQSKYSGDVIATSLQSLTSQTALNSEEINGIVTTLIQANFLIASKGTNSLLKSGISPTSNKIRYRLNSAGTNPNSNKFLMSPSPSRVSSSNIIRTPQNNAAVPLVVDAFPISEPTYINNNNTTTTTTTNNNNGSFSTLSIVTFYIFSSVLLWYARDDEMLHTIGLLVVGIIILWKSIYSNGNNKKNHISNTTSFPSSPSIPNNTNATTSMHQQAIQNRLQNQMQELIGIPIPSKPPYRYHGPHPLEFQKCISATEKGMRSTYNGGIHDNNWKCCTQSISGLSKYNGAYGSVFKLNLPEGTPGHKYSKFKLELYIPLECGTLEDVVRSCKNERLQWDVAMNEAKELHRNYDSEPCADGSKTLLKTMLYTTQKQFGISPRAFIEREWNIQFQDGSMYSFSNSLPFEEQVPQNAIANLTTPHTRGINYPGSAWLFEKIETDHFRGTKMIQIIHSDLKGWIYPGLVNMSLNSHLGNFSKVLLAYIAKNNTQ